MKRFLCLLISLAVSLSVAYAESFDLSTMNNDDLIGLKAKVETEIKSRGITGIPISEGVYAVSVSFQEGGYTFTSYSDGREDNYVWVYLGVFSDEKDVWNDDKALITFCLTESGQTYHLDLKEGQILHITVPGGTCTYIPDQK